MKYYESLSQLLSEWKKIPSPGTIYAQSLRAADIENQGYWVFSDEEQQEEKIIETKKGDLIPKSIYKHNVKSVFETATLKAIVKNKIKHNSDLEISNTNIFIEAINYYLDFDTFLD